MEVLVATTSSGQTSAISLKVSRFISPYLSLSCLHPIDPLISRSFKIQEDKNFLEETLQENVSISEALALHLPNTAEKIFCGEMFRFLIQLINKGINGILKDMKLQVFLISPCDTKTLYDKEPCPYLDKDESFDILVGELLETSGIHLLSCEISYQYDYHHHHRNSSYKSSLEKAKVKKTYKFSVHEPFQMHYRPVFINTNQLLVQCTCINRTGFSIFLDSISLGKVPSCFQSDLCSFSEEKKEFASPNLITLRSEDIISFVCRFILKYRESVPQDITVMIEIRWRRSIGDERTTRIPLTLQMEGFSPCHAIVFRVRSCPSTVSVEVPFNISVECINHTTSQLKPVIYLNASSCDAIVSCGETLRKTSTPIESGMHFAVDFCFIALRSGFHRVDNIFVMDETTQMTQQIEAVSVFAI